MIDLPVASPLVSLSPQVVVRDGIPNSDLPVASPPVSLSPQVVVPEENPLGDDEVDGVLASMDMDFNTPPSSPPVSFLQSWTISERQRIEDRRRSNLLRGVQLKTRHEKFKKNRQNAEAALERSKRNEALAKKELASFRSKMCKDEAEAKRMFGDAI
ncbi:hypothetical protein DAPPUDRAFT_266377 [Daphnia pulex]|uniref:Uncharacterized protein n=1 Tax=Daphnia pulex TaxID=6669 RepID=E9HUY2_DAPPU|nr:hypothetical protein DAPPUDRAFT_266377 [Daphnia pulex]|eukprot:EFX64449.1 hypothetical protein DAPPUDRAFT_266377 [Daphnia pulex]